MYSLQEHTETKFFILSHYIKLTPCALIIAPNIGHSEKLTGYTVSLDLFHTVRPSSKNLSKF